MGRSLTTGQIADHTKVPPGYLSKVLQSLTRAHLISSQRGSGGGVRLARAPEEISILDVVNAVEPVQRINRCPLDLKAHAAGLCPLHRKLDEAAAYLEQTFSSLTLADLTTPAASSFPLGLCPQRRTSVVLKAK